MRANKTTKKRANKKVTLAANKVSVKGDTYLKNLPMFPQTGKYSLEKLVTGQSDHTNHAGVKETSLPLITEPLGPKIVVISDSHPLMHRVLILENTTT